MTARLGVVAAAALVLLAACNRQGDSANQAAAPAASAPAQAPASAASQPASAAAAQPLVPEQVVMAGAANPQDAQAGQQLAQQGAGAAAACVGCHGANGEGNAQGGFPRLAGQGRLYLVHQLESYANGSRKHPVMQPIAAALNDTQRRQVAAYYAGLGTPPGAAATSQREPALAARGDDKRQLQACANCHAPQGIGDAAFNPYLAGQHAGYLTAALAAWKSGDRNNDPSGQMPRIARTLTDDDVRTLVQYYASLTPPGPRNAQIAAAALPGGRTAVQSGPVRATAPALGQGSEQGALTGGSQSQGAGGTAQTQGQTPNTAGTAQTPATGASSTSPASGKP